MLAQKKHKSRINWDDYRHEVVFGFGGSHYLGELGGSDGSSAQFSPKDVELSQTKYAFSLAYRYNFGKYLSVSPRLYYGKLAGSDQLTKQPQRNNRNLAFNTQIIEFAVMAEGHLFRANYGQGFYRKGVLGSPGQKFGVSAHLGLGFFYFNPKYGSVKLRPLKTEGQGLPGGGKEYSRFAICVPMGFKLSYQLTKQFRIGLDLTYRYAFTDYLDDVSGKYYDKETLRKENGDLSAELSDRSDGSNPVWSQAGSPRGNPKSKDGYFTTEITLTYAPRLHFTGIKKRRKRARF